MDFTIKKFKFGNCNFCTIKQIYGKGVFKIFKGRNGGIMPETEYYH